MANGRCGLYNRRTSNRLINCVQRIFGSNLLALIADRSQGVSCFQSAGGRGGVIKCLGPCYVPYNICFMICI